MRQADQYFDQYFYIKYKNDKPLPALQGYAKKIEVEIQVTKRSWWSKLWAKIKNGVSKLARKFWSKLKKALKKIKDAITDREWWINVLDDISFTAGISGRYIIIFSPPVGIGLLVASAVAEVIAYFLRKYGPDDMPDYNIAGEMA
jgi:hypothetical protein